MTSFEVLVSNHQLVAGDRVSTRAFKDAPGIFPLRVLYYASPPDLCTDVTMPNCRHKKAAKLSGADDRFEVLVRSVCDSSGGFVKSCRPYLAVSRAIRAFPQIWGKLSAKYSPLTASCRLATTFLLWLVNLYRHVALSGDYNDRTRLKAVKIECFVKRIQGQRFFILSVPPTPSLATGYTDNPLSTPISQIKVSVQRGPY